MTENHILAMGNPRLYQSSQPVNNFATAELKQLITKLTEMMVTHQGVGIAAPQIGIFQQVMMIGIDNNPRYPYAEPIPLTTFINPQWQASTEEKVFGWEGCLSVPGIRAILPRYRKIKYHAYDVNGKYFSGEAENFFARVIQHEHDHIHGILFPQRVIDIRHIGIESEMMSYVKTNEIPSSWQTIIDQQQKQLEK